MASPRELSTAQKVWGQPLRDLYASGEHLCIVVLCILCAVYTDVLSISTSVLCLCTLCVLCTVYCALCACTLQRVLLVCFFASLDVTVLCAVHFVLCAVAGERCAVYRLPVYCVQSCAVPDLYGCQG
jgi:hypothetical protein